MKMVAEPAPLSISMRTAWNWSRGVGKYVAGVGLGRGGRAHVGMLEGDGELRGGGPEHIGHNPVEIGARGEVVEVDLLGRAVGRVWGEGVGNLKDGNAVQDVIAGVGQECGGRSGVDGNALACGCNGNSSEECGRRTFTCPSLSCRP